MRNEKSALWGALDFILGLMIVGPLLAPLFVGSGLWLFERIAGWIIYPLGLWICPQEQHLLSLGAHPMSVCSRCYAAIGGLWLVRLSLGSNPDGRGVASSLARLWRGVSGIGRAAFIGLVIGLWQVDVWAEWWGWWQWGHAGLIATGPLVGLALGFLIYTTLAILTGRVPAWEKKEGRVSQVEHSPSP